MRLLILLLTTLFIFLSSCTIQKRTFRSGYYISRNKSVPKGKSDVKAADEFETKTEGMVQSPSPTDTLCEEETKLSEELAVIGAPDTLPTDTCDFPDQALKKPETLYSETALLDRLAAAVTSVKEKKYPLEEEELPKREINLFALNAFVFAIGYLILIFYAFDNINLNWPVVLAVLSLFTAIIFAVFALVKWKRKRTGFWGTFFALIALILLVAGTFAFLIYTISNSSFG